MQPAGGSPHPPVTHLAAPAGDPGATASAGRANDAGSTARLLSLDDVRGFQDTVDSLERAYLTLAEKCITSDVTQVGLVATLLAGLAATMLGLAATFADDTDTGLFRDSDTGFRNAAEAFRWCWQAALLFSLGTLATVLFLALGAARFEIPNLRVIKTAWDTGVTASRHLKYVMDVAKAQKNHLSQFGSITKHFEQVTNRVTADCEGRSSMKHLRRLRILAEEYIAQETSVRNELHSREQRVWDQFCDEAMSFAQAIKYKPSPRDKLHSLQQDHLKQIRTLAEKFELNDGWMDLRTLTEFVEEQQRLLHQEYELAEAQQRHLDIKYTGQDRFGQSSSALPSLQQRMLEKENAVLQAEAAAELAELRRDHEEAVRALLAAHNEKRVELRQAEEIKPDAAAARTDEQVELRHGDAKHTSEAQNVKEARLEWFADITRSHEQRILDLERQWEAKQLESVRIHLRSLEQHLRDLLSTDTLQHGVSRTDRLQSFTEQLKSTKDVGTTIIGHLAAPHGSKLFPGLMVILCVLLASSILSALGGLACYMLVGLQSTSSQVLALLAFVVVLIVIAAAAWMEHARIQEALQTSGAAELVPRKVEGSTQEASHPL